MTTPSDHPRDTAAQSSTTLNDRHSRTERGTEAESESDTAGALTTSAALFREHDQLIQLQGSEHDTEELVAAARHLLRKGRPLGWFLQDCVERRECQRVLNYWSVFLYREMHEDVPSDLLPYDPAKAPELDESQFPFRFEEGYATRAQQLSGWRRLLDECEQKLAEDHFVAVIGSSGSGRDVLVNRVLLPLLEQGSARRSEFASSPSWRYCVCSPRKNPLASLISAVSDSPVPDPAWIAEQVERLRRDEFTLRELLDSLSPEPTFLVIEQLESLLTYPNPKDIQAFLGNLRSVLADDKPKHFVVVILRRDRATHLSSLGPLEEPVRQSQVLMNFTTAELRRFIEEPAAEVGLIFERGVLDKVLVDLQGEPTVLPLLRITMRRLWRYRDRNRITWESYQKAGAGRAALERAAEDCYAELDEQQRTLLPAFFAKFVAPELGGALVPCDADRDDLNICDDAKDVDKIRQTFENADLLRDVSNGRRQTYRLRYEAILTSWPRLMDWLDDYRRVHRRRLRLSEAARLWDTESRAEDSLWSGTLLRDYVESFGQDPCLTTVEKGFLEAGQLREARSRRRWLMVRYSLVTMGLLTVAFLALYLRSLRTAISQRMLQDSLIQIQDGDYSGAITWLSKRAHRVADSPAEKVRLQVALRYCPEPNQLWFAEKEDFEAEKAAKKDKTKDAENAAKKDTRSPRYTALTSLPGIPGNKFVAVKSKKGDVSNDPVKPKELRLDVFDAQSLECETLAQIPTPADPPRDFDSWPTSIAWAPVGNILLLAATDLYWTKFDGTSSGVNWSQCEPQRQNNSVFTTVRCVRAKSEPPCDLVLALEKQANQQVGRLHVWRMTYESGRTTFHEFTEFSQPANVYFADFSPTGNMVVVLRGEMRDVNGSFEGAQAFEVWQQKAPSDVTEGTSEWQPKSASEWATKAADKRGRSWGWQPLFDAEEKSQASWHVLESGIFFAAFHPSGEALVTATNAGRVNFWGMEPGIWPYLEKSIDLGVRIFHVGFTNDGKRLLTSSRDRITRVWDYDSLVEVLPRMHHEGSVHCAIEIGQDKLLTNTERILRLWKWHEPELQYVSENDAAASGDGRRVLSTCRFLGSANSRYVAEVLQGPSSNSISQPELRITYSQKQNNAPLSLPWGSEGVCEINELKFGESKEKVFLAVAAKEGEKGVVFLFHLKADEPTEPVRLPHEEAALSSAFSADGILLATTDQHDCAKIWDVERTLVPRSEKDEEHKPAFELKHTSDVVRAAFSPEISKDVYHLVTVSSDGEAPLWNIYGSELQAWRKRPEAVLKSKEAVAKLYHGARITDAAWTPADSEGASYGHLIVTASRDRTARIWDADTAQLVGILRHSCPVVKAQFVAKDQIETFGEVESSKSGLVSPKYVWNLKPKRDDPPPDLRERARLGDDDKISEARLQLLSSRKLVGNGTRLKELEPSELYDVAVDAAVMTGNK
ncbi:MAG: WD40 repeat domain-containing protein [Pirellulaceae bacterium]